MKKHLITVAVLSALAAPAAMAADIITMYGQVNLGYSYNDNYGITEKMHRIDGMGPSSRIGFRGTEQLGDDMSAFFQLESTIAPDDASASGAFGTREAWVGLSGKSWGSIGLGRGKTPYTNAVELLDNAMDGRLGLAYYEVDKGITRYNNTVKYTSPNLSGFVGTLMLATGENGDSSKPNAEVKNTFNYAMHLNYKTGPVMLVGAYANEANVGGVYNRDNESFFVGGEYMAQDWFVHAGLQHLKKDNVDAKTSHWKRTSFGLNGGYYLDKKNLIRAGFIYGDKYKSTTPAGVSTSVADSQYVQWQVGYKYLFSKRTSFVTEYGSINYGDHKVYKLNTDPKVFSVGILHAF